MAGRALPLVVLLVLGARLPAARAATEAGRERLRGEVLHEIAAGRPDSARALLRVDLQQSRDVVEYLLADRAGLAALGHADSAQVLMESARRIALLYRETFNDSLCLRIVGFHDTLAAPLCSPTAEGWAGLREARSLAEHAAWPRSHALIPGIMAGAIARRDPWLEEQCLRLDAQNLFFSGEIDSARAMWEHTLLVATRVRDRACEARTLGNIALTYQHQDRYNEVIGTYRRVLAAARESGDTELYVATHAHMGTSFWRLGQLDSAFSYLAHGDTLAGQAGLKLHQATVVANLAGVYGDLGAEEKALAMAERALGIAREAGPVARRTEVVALLTSGSTLSDLGRHSEALRRSREALDLAEASGLTELAAGARSNIGSQYAVMGRTEEAIRFIEEAIPVMVRTGNVGQQSSLNGNLGELFVTSGRPAEARRAFEAACDQAALGERRLALATALANLGGFYRTQGEFELAESTLLRARSIADSIEHPIVGVMVTRQLALIDRVRGRTRKAADALAGALATLRRHGAGAPTLVEECLRDEAQLARDAGDLVRADSLLTAAMNLVETARGREEGEEMRSGVLAGRRAVFVERASVLNALAANHPEGEWAGQAFDVSERAHARALLDFMTPGLAVPAAGLDSTLYAREQRLSGRISKIQADLTRAVAADHWDSTRVDSLESQLDGATRELTDVREEISTRDPRFGALAGTRAPISIADLRARVLARDQVLIEYLLGEKEGFVFLVTPDRERFIRIADGERQIAAEVETFRRLLHDDGAGDSLRAAGRSLFERLLAPVAAEFPPDSRIVIVPDGSLFYLPFEALMDGELYLAEQHPVSYAPSASVLDPALPGGRRRPAPALLAVGNPHTYREETLRASVREGDRWRWGELPFAGAEVERIARYFPRARTLTGVEATEEAVKSAAPGVSCLHLATHGLLNEEEPLLSGLALAQDDDPGEDGILQTYEILRMKLDADLVVLSGCNTGLGRLTGGEGVLGLTRAFLHAGARALLISLWEVNDRSTPDFMDDFYRARFEERLTMDRALHAAKRAAIARGAPPREWAAFCLVGDMTLPPARERLPWSLSAAVIAAVLLVSSVLWRRRRTRPVSR